MLEADEPLDLDPLAALAMPYVPAVTPKARAAKMTIRFGRPTSHVAVHRVTSFPSLDEAHLRVRN
jgi:hypothetical protein